MMMKKSLVWILGCAAFLVVSLGMAVKGSDTDAVTIERSGIRLEVPKRYLHENRFPWIDKVQALDSDKSSFMIKVPAEEIESILPESVTKGTSAPINLTVVVFLMTPDQRKTAIDNAQITANEIANRELGFSGAYAEFDKESGFYNVYMLPKHHSRWNVFARPPFDDPSSIRGEDFIATCHKDKHIGTTCTLSQLVLDNMMIEFGLKYEHLPYYKNVRDYTADLLKSWRAQ